MYNQEGKVEANGNKTGMSDVSNPHKCCSTSKKLQRESKGMSGRGFYLLGVLLMGVKVRCPWKSPALLLAVPLLISPISMSPFFFDRFGCLAILDLYSPRR
jgi:hypothetical protein